MFFLLFLFSRSPARAAGDTILFHGASDASAAVAVGKDRFVVADDENNILRLYGADRPERPLAMHDLTSFLDVDAENPEADIEGAARASGSRVYWIASHGRNKDGKIRESRYRFFATDIETKADGMVDIRPVGVPCKRLLYALLDSESARGLDLERRARLEDKKISKKDLEKLAPKENGINIEGLCAAPGDERLFIGFRNPPGLVVPLENPADVAERGAAPRFGKPIQWRLDGLGVRSMEYAPAHKAFFIVAGPVDGKRASLLYRWTGVAEAAPTLARGFMAAPEGFNPEAMMAFGARLLFLSDDGTKMISVSSASEVMPGEEIEDGRCENKYLIDPAKRTFRGFWMAP